MSCQQHSSSIEIEFRFVWPISRFVVRALKVVATGQHHLLLVGPRAATALLAARLIDILPGPSPVEARAISENYAASGLRIEEGTRPVRSPDRSVALSRFTLSASAPRLGELGLSAHGVLQLRDVLEFDAVVLERLGEALRLDAPEVPNLGREQWGLRSAPLVVATMDACPCGNLSNPHLECQCDGATVASFHRRLAPAMRDVCHVVMCVPFEEPRLPSAEAGVEESASSRDGVAAAWAFRTRLAEQGITIHSRLTRAAVECTESFVGKKPMERVAGVRLLRVATTVANLAGSVMVTDTEVRDAAAFVVPTRTFSEMAGWGTT